MQGQSYVSYPPAHPSLESQVVSVREHTDRTLLVDIETLKVNNVKMIVISAKDGTKCEVTPEELAHRLGLEW